MMFEFRKNTFILPIICLSLLGCRQTKFVPEGKYLLKKNKIEVFEANINNEEINEIIRQKPNYKTIGIKLRLMAFNMVDSTKVITKRQFKNKKIREKNLRRIKKQTRINQERILKARAKNQDYYTEKLIQLKDTANPRMFLKEWIKYKLGEKPVVFDSIPYKKSLEQLDLFLNKKGYYRGSTLGKVDYLKNNKCNVTYKLYPGEQYLIDTLIVKCENPVVLAQYNKFICDNPDLNLKGHVFDSDFLNKYRNQVARYMRDHTIYGFSSSHIFFEADTLSQPASKVKLTIQFTDRMLRSTENKDSLVAFRHRSTFVKEVFFHIIDTTDYKGDFNKEMEALGINLLNEQYIPTLDTFVYACIKKKKTGELDRKRIATFYYNERLAVDADILEMQNYLENENVYKEYYLERSVTRLRQLGLFQIIKPEIVEIPNSDSIEVHYFLVPVKRKSFGYEPRATTSNGFLGLSLLLKYTNKNLFRGSEKLTFGLMGGVESQPPIFESDVDGDLVKQSGRSLNTYQIIPSVKIELPGLFPVKASKFSKRQRPFTEISLAYNYEIRTEFQRQIFQYNYLYKFYVGKTQLFRSGLPFLSVLNLVKMLDDDFFQEKIDDFNDPFLKNIYSDQFIWQDWKLTFEYRNLEKEKRRNKLNFFFNSSFDPAGNTLSLFKKSQKVENGKYTVFGLPYSQFVRLDVDMVASHPLGKKQGIHGRFQAGCGIPYGNTTTSLPFDYSFFAGGSVDNRGWRARTLGPGSYKYYLDTLRTATQTGDIRIGMSLEYRFPITQSLKGALFTDAGNIWTYNTDNNRLGSKFEKDFVNELALSAGLGIRLDLEFFILRFDFGIPLSNPALPKDSRWIFQSRDAYNNEGLAVFGPNFNDYLPKAFIPNFHLGIGYPF